MFFEMGFIDSQESMKLLSITSDKQLRMKENVRNLMIKAIQQRLPIHRLHDIKWKSIKQIYNMLVTSIAD